MHIPHNKIYFSVNLNKKDGRKKRLIDLFAHLVYDGYTHYCVSCAENTLYAAPVSAGWVGFRGRRIWTSEARVYRLFLIQEVAAGPLGPNGRSP